MNKRYPVRVIDKLLFMTILLQRHHMTTITIFVSCVWPPGI